MHAKNLKKVMNQYWKNDVRRVARWTDQWTDQWMDQWTASDKTGGSKTKESVNHVQFLSLKLIKSWWGAQIPDLYLMYTSSGKECVPQ